MLINYGKVKINGKPVTCKIVAMYKDGTCRIEYQTYLNGRYNGNEAATVDAKDVIFFATKKKKKWDADTIEEFAKRLSAHYPHSNSILRAIEREKNKMLKERVI